eukprot:CAMPEP_0197538132 /NCGR_PEP_ID=MMETSP1318-20131121/58908_1 /TAXON_ID=552666 /ORGANISM="Partenskyella glossopodia, Strain RCC365" /LENGTH=211 /DNA_ID=CAMNT_0043096469 /DNA_START=951 /DNA_END=1586 /DNA_ORIENTATION=-
MAFEREGGDEKQPYRFLVGLAGIPASGKTTLASKLVKSIKSKGVSACLLPMDGFHYSRAHLDTMPDPRLAHARRGAEWTFDAEGLEKVLTKIADSKELIQIPGFDHKEKDPKPGQHAVAQHDRIVLVEGLYLLMSKSKRWHAISNRFRLRCFLFTSFSTAEKRIVPRHVEAGIVQDEKQALQRWFENDKVNGMQILDGLDEAQIDVKIVTM